MQALFKPFSLKTLKLKNRIVMAPMTRAASPGGVVTDDVAEYYSRRAEGGAGLIISEGTGINRPSSLNEPGLPHFYGSEALAGWKKVINSVHTAGGTMIPQLWHVGAAPNQQGGTAPDPVESPSGLYAANKQVGTPMSDNDIADTINAFAKAAVNAKELGFNGIELHGAHGYIIDQFFWKDTNLRTDIFGGKTISQRNRFAVEILKAVRAAVGDDFAISLRLSQWKTQDYGARLANTPHELEEWLLPLSDAGADIFHCSQRRFWEAEFKDSALNFAGWAKKITGKATISVGSVGLSGEFLSAFKGEKSEAAPLEQLLERMDKNEFDLIAVGRAMIVNPDWANKVKNGDLKNLKGFSRESLSSLY
ncbi:NADH:flavin oxidoreductase [Lelliottia amnigena]|uniref:NADH:flavin oxidoreductase n=1 Tax=Enterobacterales TaxID=91347 RepID=UPI00192B34DD|nr:NADH:flavin oxidoreductase [Lelliottia amnigena]MBL5923194.1 NADH:flavin oxidoreductase [Lelliottia amnigena]